MTNYLHQSFQLQPHTATNRHGEILDLTQVTHDLAQDIQLLTDATEWTLLTDIDLLDRLDNYQGYTAPAKIGARIGINFPTGTIYDTWRTGKSRYEHLYRHRVISEAKAWNERIKAANGTSTKHVSQGWQRTANDNAPTFSPHMNLGAVDQQYARISVDGTALTLEVIVSGAWKVFHFTLPKKRFDHADKITLPMLRVTRKGGVVFQFSAATQYNNGPISSRYIVGVDVGVNNYVVLSVFDRELGRSVYSESLSERVHSLYNSCKRTALNVRGLRGKGKRREAGEQRRANVRKKRELAVVAGQEIASVAAGWGNAVVVFEDLSWVVNTMSHGRWNRGELFRWAQHFVEQNGSRVYKVSAARTSTHCSVCDEKLVQLGWSTMRCDECDVVVHRDVDAAASVAKRFDGSLDKMLESRAKGKSYHDKVVRRSPKRHLPGLSVVVKSRDKVRATPRRRKPVKCVRVRVNRRVVVPVMSVGGVFTCSVALGALTVLTDSSSSWGKDDSLRGDQSKLLPIVTT